ncbi:MAG: hypothetical protein EXS18_05110 [Verrucomicrobiae bacterium]|nr:hypothetical protein [Verrucomicrobiae bacterium]
MYPKKHAGPRELFRIEESQRVDEAATLAAKYPQLKSLTADLHFSDSERSTVNSRIKYSINLEVSKSVFRFSCPNNECIRGDYDLSEELADAIAERRTVVSGEKPCPGWLSKTTIDTVHCRSILHYRLTIAYVATRARATASASSR